MTEIKIHGLQRSGTNYLAYLINQNFDATALVNTGGWKHGPYMAHWELGHEVHVAVVTKNPYAWLVSLYNYWGPERQKNVGPDLAGVPFKDFVHNRAYFEQQKGVPYLLRASNPVQHWNNMYFHWTSIQLKEKVMLPVPYEFLLAKKDRMLDQMAKIFGLARHPELKDCDKVLLPAGENPVGGKDDWDKSEYYKLGRYMEMYDKDTLAFVNDQLDLDLMIAFGYEYKEMA